MLATEHLWWLLMQDCIHAGVPLSMCMQIFHSVLSSYCSTANQPLSLGSIGSFLYLTKSFIKIQMHLLLLLRPSVYFLVFQVERLWHLLSTVSTVKPLVSLLFHCQWNHCNCTASIPTHCTFMAPYMTPFIT